MKKENIKAGCVPLQVAAGRYPLAKALLRVYEALLRLYYTSAGRCGPVSARSIIRSVACCRLTALVTGIPA